MKITYEEFTGKLKHINEKKDQAMNYYKGLVINVNGLYTRNVITLSELTEMLTRITHDQAEHIARLNREIDRLPDYELSPIHRMPARG